MSPVDLFSINLVKIRVNVEGMPSNNIQVIVDSLKTECILDINDKYITILVKAQDPNADPSVCRVRDYINFSNNNDVALPNNNLVNFPQNEDLIRLNSGPCVNSDIVALSNEITNIIPICDNDMSHDLSTPVNLKQFNVKNKRLMNIRSSLNIHVNNKSIINLTNINIPDNVFTLLSFGPKFNIPLFYSASDYSNLISCIKSIGDLYLLPYETKYISRLAKEHIEAYQDKINSGDQFNTDIQNYFHKALNDTKEFFKNHSELVAISTDKTKATCILKKSIYINKVQDHLNNPEVYQSINISSKKGLISKNRIILNKLVDLKLISKSDAINCSNVETEIPKLYGLLKDHKPEIPIRPITNTINSPGYRISELIISILKPIAETSKYNVKNSGEVMDRISNIDISPDHFFHKLDIVNMFTNIKYSLVEKALQAKKHLIKMDLKVLLELIRFACYHCTEFSFNNSLYKQIKGLRMGLPCSPILADIATDFIFETVMSNVDFESPLLLIKYVDDCLLVASREYAIDFNNKINAIDQDVNFTLETEDHNKITYLDIEFTNLHNFSIKTKWYSKEISSNRLLNYFSNHKYSTIYNTAKTYFINTLKISDKEFHENTIVKVKNMFIKNNYPLHLIHKIISEALRVLNNEGSSSNLCSYSNGNDNREKFFSRIPLPYLKDVSPSVSRIIKTVQPNLTIACKNKHTLATKIYNRHKYLR